MKVLSNQLPTTSPANHYAGVRWDATGIHEAIYCLLMIQNDFICASADIDSAAADFPIVTKRMDNQPLNTAMLNNFGFFYKMHRRSSA